MPKKKIEKKTEKKSQTYYEGVGRRKEAIAIVRLTISPESSMVVNGVAVEEYFSDFPKKQIYLEPFRTTNTLNRFKTTINVSGSGKNAQMDAIINGVARALIKVEPEKYRPILRKRGFLTRDPRTRERRKVGHGGKARREKQSPKR